MTEALVAKFNFETRSPSKARVDLLRELIAEACGGVVGPAFPVIAPAMLLSHESMVQASGLMSPTDGKSTLHETQVFEVSQQIEADQDWAVSVACARENSKVKLNCDLRIQDHTAAGMVTRLRFIDPEEMRALKGTAFSERLNSPDTRWVETISFSQDFVRRYLELAGDENPIHTDERAAKAAGLKGVVVPGMLFCAICETMAAQVVAKKNVRELRTRFLSAVRVGEAVRVGVTPKPDSVSGEWNAARVFVVSQTGMLVAISDLKF